MQKIIITADDYGMCDEVDKAIDAGIKNAFITTTNVMVNMGDLNNASTLRERFPDISVGIHWNVTTGKPVLSPDVIPTLVDLDGNFWSINEFKKRYNKGLIKPEDLEKEIEAQYNIFEKICGKPDYWNTHENSSLSIVAFKAFKKVALNHHIKATRNFQRVYYDKVDLGFKREVREFLVKNFFGLWFDKIKKDLVKPSARIASFGKISKTEGTVLLDALLSDGRDYIEVVFHPAITGDNPWFGNISSARVDEYKFVSSKEKYNIYREKGILFSNFADIC